MNRSKRILCLLLACMVTGTAVSADEIIVPAPTEAVESPEPDPMEEPAEQPTAEATQTPTAEPSETPTTEPTVVPSEAPTTEPTVEPSEEPTVEPTIAPSSTPEVSPTTTPAARIEIIADSGTKLGENIWQIPAQMPDSQIVFRWNPVEGANAYEILVTDAQETEIHRSEVLEPMASLPASGFGKDTYTLTVFAWFIPEADESAGESPEPMLLMQGEAQFVLSSGGFPGGFPGGGFPGGFPGGGAMGSMSGGMPGGEMTGEPSFRVTPGEALTDSHSSGSKDMRIYGTVLHETSESAMSVLTMDDTQLDVSLDCGSSFFAVCEDGVLVLTPEADAETWSISGLALKILGRSGIESVRMMFGDEWAEILTGWTLQGQEYARLCAEGYVSKDYTFIVTRTDMLVEAAGRTYRINENNEMVGG